MSMTLPKYVLVKYVRDVFVETGTHEGGGVSLALSVGFKKVLSVEVDPATHEIAKQRVGSSPGVELSLADSLDWLPKVVESLSGRATFWLDAHMFPDGKKRALGRLHWPLLEELRLIKQSTKRADHTFLIDDRTAWKTAFDIDEADVRKVLLEINPGYSFSCVDSLYRKGDILIAT